MERYKYFLSERIDEQGNLIGVDYHAPETYNFGFDVVDWYGKNEPQRRAMIWTDDAEERIFTFADIMKQSAQTANYFKSLGIVKGDRVLLVLRRHWEFWVVAVALHKLGAIAIPATDQLKEKDIVYRCNAAGVKAVVCTAVGDVIGEATAAIEK